MNRTSKIRSSINNAKLQNNTDSLNLLNPSSAGITSSNGNSILLPFPISATEEASSPLNITILNHEGFGLSPK